VIGTISLPSGATIRLRPLRRWNLMPMRDGERAALDLDVEARIVPDQLTSSFLCPRVNEVGAVANPQPWPM